MCAEKIIRQLNLKPHMEGGYYKETYKSPHTITIADGQQRSMSTAIFYLLQKQDISCFHRIQSDELWFFHQGSPLEIITLRDGQDHTICLGNNLEQGEIPHTVIPANTWLAARMKNRSGYALVSCTVAPGFEYEDLQMATEKQLIQEFPHLAGIIQEFTP
ncbi:MAG: cupin domain-containing protein [Bacteroidales bacterium]